MAAFIFSQIASRRAYQSILGFEEPFGRPPLLRISSVRLGSAIGVCSICSSISVIVPPCSPFPLLPPHGWQRVQRLSALARSCIYYRIEHGARRSSVRRGSCSSLLFSGCP